MSAPCLVWLARQRLSGTLEQVVGGGRPRILVILAALSEVAGAALAREQRDRGLHALLSRLHGGLERGVDLGPGLERLDRRDQRVDHRLVAGLGLAARLHALQSLAP